MADAAKEEFHPSFPNFKEVGSLDVDAGSIWVGDDCYVLKDKDKPRPKDLGDDWHGICKRFFDRSGYSAYSREWQRWAHYRDSYLFNSAEWAKWMEEYSKDPEHQRPGSEAYKRKHDIMTKVYERYETETPFTPTAVDTGCANFTHDAGHGGMGMMISTFHGDGSYPVYIEYGEGGRPRRVLIDFDPGGDELEDEVEILEAAE